jgi:hypothetical protein
MKGNCRFSIYDCRLKGTSPGQEGGPCPRSSLQQFKLRGPASWLENIDLNQRVLVYEKEHPGEFFTQKVVRGQVLHSEVVSRSSSSLRRSEMFIATATHITPRSEGVQCHSRIEVSDEQRTRSSYCRRDTLHSSRRANREGTRAIDMSLLRSEEL